MNPTHGGPCQGIRNSIPALEKLGTHNEVVSLDDPKASFLGSDPFAIHAMGPASGPWGYGARLIPWLAEHANTFDVIIVHGLWQYYSHATGQAMQAIRRAKPGSEGPRWFVMPHGMLDPYFQAAPDRKLKAIRNYIYWKLIERKVVNNSDGLLFTCEAEMVLARKPYRPYHPKAELNVGYGIQAHPSFEPGMAKAFLVQCPAIANKPFVLFLSRVHEKKGVDLLINAYAKLPADNRPALVVAGPGMDSAYGKKIKDLTTALGLQDEVHFPGMLNGAAKWGAFYGCEAFILPSHQENFGIAVVEAMACGKPVLISSQVNIWKEIREENSGLVDDDTVDGAHRLLKQWVGTTDTAKKTMGDQARRTFEKLFAIDPAADRLIRALDR
jgi:glycosyltransferase involved in cell wall biosynthesis